MDEYYVYVEDGDLWLAFGDDGEHVAYLGDVADLVTIQTIVLRHKEGN